MNSHQNTVICFLAAFFGFIGGALFTKGVPTAYGGSDTVRAARFELVDDAGNAISTWGTDAENRTALSFRAKNKTDLAAFGVSKDELPFVKLNGRDGATRAIFYLYAGERPLLGMNDGKYEGRVLLGFLQSDFTSPNDDDWGLLFRKNSADPLASIGMVRDFKGGSLSGTLSVRDSNGKRWSAPLSTTAP